MRKKINANNPSTSTNSIEAEFEWIPQQAERVKNRQVATLDDLAPANTKVKISLYIDLDIVKEFKQRAQAANSAPYQTQINQALRTFLESDKKSVDYSKLLEDEGFIKALATKLASHQF